METKDKAIKKILAIRYKKPTNEKNKSSLLDWLEIYEKSCYTYLRKVGEAHVCTDKSYNRLFINEKPN